MKPLYSMSLVAAILFCTPSYADLSLKKFSGTPSSNSVKLSWCLYSQCIPGNFYVERSYDGFTFEVLDTVSAGELLEFSFEDRTALEGTVYYRLNEPGSSSSSSVIAVEYAPVKQRITITPNPSQSSVIALNVSGFETGMACLLVTDLLGRTYYSSGVEISETGNGMIYLDPSGLLHPGVYIVCAWKNGRQIKERLIIR